jgi:hypothetical protein
MSMELESGMRSRSPALAGRVPSVPLLATILFLVGFSMAASAAEPTAGTSGVIIEMEGAV